jgi:hypothetical protein
LKVLLAVLDAAGETPYVFSTINKRMKRFLALVLSRESMKYTLRTNDLQTRLKQNEENILCDNADFVFSRLAKLNV